LNSVVPSSELAQRLLYLLAKLPTRRQQSQKATFYTL